MSESAHVALLGFATGNLGDDLQSLAVALHLPFVDRLVRRDGLASERLDAPHLVVMNSWFTRQFVRPPSASIEPVFHGFCVGRREMTFGLWPRYLRRHQPIGCRDTGSVGRLARIGIAATWTGCLTLGIGAHLERVPDADRRGVVLLDVPAEAEAALPAAIRERAERLTNDVPDAIRADPLARFARVAAVMDRLRRAELVVTRRLHAALPCVGFGTPVMTLVEEERANRHRFTGFDRFLNLRFYRTRADLAGIDWTAIRPVAIPAEIEAATARLRERLAGRLGAVGGTTYPELARRLELSVPLPAGAAPDAPIALDFGTTRVLRRSEAVEAGRARLVLDGFAALERFRLPVLAGDGRGGFLAAGRLDRLVAAAS